MKRYMLTGRSAGLLAVLLAMSFNCFSVEPPQSAEAGKIVALVDKAVALIESKGQDAFQEFGHYDSEWYRGDTYIFVNDMNGTSLVNPPSPDIEGDNLIDMKDAKGKPFVREMIETAKAYGSGWVVYWWSKPGNDKPVKKQSYIRQAKMPDGKTVIVGSGIYID